MIELPKPEKHVQAIKRWKELLPDYEKQIKSIAKEVAKPVNLYPPPDFQERVSKAKQAWQEGQDLQAQYIDVLLYHIQGKQNMTIIEMAEYLTQTLGKDRKYWSNKCILYASINKYGDSLSLWEVKKQFYQYMHLTQQELSNIRIFRQHSKKYINTLTKFIKCVKQAVVQTDLQKIDKQFKSASNAQSKYTAFIKRLQINLDDQKSNVSKKNKNKVINTLFAYMDKKPEKNPTTLPLQGFGFTSKKIPRPSNKIKIPLSGDIQKAFEQTLNNLSEQKWKIELSQLRKDCIDQAESNKKQLQQKDPIYISIFNPDFYFLYENHPISLESQRNIDFLNPFKHKEQIDYEMNSEDEYGQLLGESLSQADSEQIVDDTMESQGSFLVSDDDNQSVDSSCVKVKYTVGISGKQWVFSSRNYYENADEIQGYSMLSVNPVQQLPFPVCIQQGNQKKSVLNAKNREIMQLIQNQKNKKQIYENFKQYNQGRDKKNRISQKKIDEFIKHSFEFQGGVYKYRNNQFSQDQQITLKQSQSEQTNSQLHAPQSISNKKNSNKKLPIQKQSKLDQKTSRKSKSKEKKGKKSILNKEKGMNNNEKQVKKQTQSVSRNHGVSTRSMSMNNIHNKGKQSV